MTGCVSMAEVEVSCLIPSAGSGDRLGLGCKGFLELAGRPLLRWLADKGRRVADEVGSHFSGWVRCWVRVWASR